jgi:hypothetical protein
VQQAEAVDASGKPVTINQGMRESLVQRFSSPKGMRPDLVVNHLKSRAPPASRITPTTPPPIRWMARATATRCGSPPPRCWEHLKDLAGDLLLIGDMNAYGMEDPIRVLTDYDPAAQSRQIMSASFTTLAGQPFEESGSALGKGMALSTSTPASTAPTPTPTAMRESSATWITPGKPSLAAKVIGIEDWHINSAESNFFEYGSKYSGQLAKSEGPSAPRITIRAGGHPVSAAARRGVEPRERRCASVEEGNTLSLTVSRSDGSHGEASVSYRIAYGSADANDVAPLTGTLHWAAGQSDSQTISIPVKSDTLREGTRPSPGAV